MLTGADSLGEREVKRKVRGEDRIAKYAAVGELPKFIEAFEQVKRATNVIQVVKLIDEFDLPREAIPTQWLNEVAVWEALLATHADDGDDPQPRQDDEHRPRSAVQ